jgi:hypothetical protein
MLDRPSEPKQQDKIESAEQINLPGEILLMINNYLPSVKDKVHSASVDHYFHGFFQPEVEKIAAKEAAEYAIHPTKENVEKLTALLKGCPALLLHPMKVTNRHGMPIKGTVYQIALHEGDNELIDDVIKEAFLKLKDGEEIMKAQRQAWLPEGWMAAEEKICESACKAIDDVFTAFKNASDPNDVTGLQQQPYTITINKQDVNKALDAFRKAIDALYKPTNDVINSGRDPSMRLLARIISRCIENYAALGGSDSPRNHAAMRAVFGYCQRPATINFMQAFATGIYYIVRNKEKLIRSYEYRRWPGYFILPLDSDPHFRLGYEYFGSGKYAYNVIGEAWLIAFQNFMSIKNNSYTNPVLCVTQLKTMSPSNL